MITGEGYELIVGSSLDPQFGPVLLFGSGGQLVEVFADRALGLPPLTSTLARRMMEQSRIYKALGGVRGRPPVDRAALEELLVRFSQLVVEQRAIKEIDINPLFVTPERQIALDARVILHGPETDLQQLPRPAIRPYPAQYVAPWQLRDGTPVTIRPIRPEDEPLLAVFHRTLSEQSVYFRYFGPLGLAWRVSHERLTRMCFVDYDRTLALVVEQTDPHSHRRQILAVGRLTKEHAADEAEFALLVSDPYQRQGLGSELLRRLIAFGRDEGLARITGSILPENLGMRTICERLGFQLKRKSQIVEAVLDL
jgi:acetyltransferase